jgi:hypothetical protein
MRNENVFCFNLTSLRSNLSGLFGNRIHELHVSQELIRDSLLSRFVSSCLCLFLRHSTVADVLTRLQSRLPCHRGSWRNHVGEEQGNVQERTILDPARLQMRCSKQQAATLLLAQLFVCIHACIDGCSHATV